MLAEGESMNQPSDPASGRVTQLLMAMHSGDAQAAEELLPLVYSELHRLAAAYMRRERPNHTLQPTALIHEAYMRLVGEDIDWTNRGQFIGFAARVMRQVLVDHARAHAAERRAGGLHRVEMDDNLAAAPDIDPSRIDEILYIDQALSRLAREDPRKARVVELRYFGGLSVEQIAAVPAELCFGVVRRNGVRIAMGTQGTVKPDTRKLPVAFDRAS
jgi:RNA polymerase sigma-70 factor (ECF subfamily)